MALPTEENTLLAFDPIKRIVPTTITRITASITAYSAMSCPCSCFQSPLRVCIAIILPTTGHRKASASACTAHVLCQSVNFINVLEGKAERAPNRNGPAREIPALRRQGYSIRKLRSVSRFVYEKLRYKPLLFD